MKLSVLKEKIRQGHSIVGVMVQDFVNPILIPILAECGYDFVILDQEHGPATHLDIQNFVIAAKNLDLAIIVRPATITYEHIAKILDMGADGLMVPHVESNQDVKHIIEWSKYPPLGNRSYGMRRILSKNSLESSSHSSAEYIKNANEYTVLFIQIESPNSANIIDSLLKEPNIDGVIMGPADFTMTLGKIGQYSDSEFNQYAEKTMISCHQNHKAFGIHFGDINLIKLWQKKGMKVLLHNRIAGIIAESGNAIIQELKPSPPSKYVGKKI